MVREGGQGTQLLDSLKGGTGKASHLLPTVLLFEVETEVQSEIMIC